MGIKRIKESLSIKILTKGPCRDGWDRLKSLNWRKRCPMGQRMNQSIRGFRTKIKYNIRKLEKQKLYIIRNKWYKLEFSQKVLETPSEFHNQNFPIKKERWRCLLPSMITNLRWSLTVMETAKRAASASAQARDEKFSFAMVSGDQKDVAIRIVANH